MAQKFQDDGAEFAESPRPILGDRQESIHPGLRPSLTSVPVTPGMHLGEEPSRKDTDPSYFAQDPSRFGDGMAQSPVEAASGAASNHEILRRMSLTGSGLHRLESLADIDPRAANPSLGLSGGVISATFCIPHSLRYRQGQDWVR
jgi:trehalose 6-phosphate synthase/phosphatase